MRESRAAVKRPPAPLLDRYSPLVDAFAIADVLIVVDGEEIRLGDYWFIASCEAEASRT